MANSDQLRKKRGALRAGVTRALTQLTDLLQQTDPDLSEVSVQVDYLKDRESALSTLDDAILALTDEENLDREVETAQDYSDKISYAIARAKYWLQERQQATRTHAQASGSGSSNLELPNSVDAPDQTPEDRIRRAKDLLTFLRIQVEVREEGRLQLRRRPHESEKMSMATESTGGAEHIPSAASLTSSAVSVNQVCPLCNSSGHSIISCNATLSADDKRVRLRNNNCCFRCGTRNHIARLCKKSYSLTCGTCRRRHLTILCELSRPVEGLPPTAESVALGRPSLPSLRTVTTAQSTHIGSTAVLLQTGRIWAECGTRRLLVRVLLDSGSQRSYIREDAARKLQCSVVGREELSLITFGNSKSQRRLRAERVSVRLRSQFDDAAVELEALTIPEICSVTSPPLENNILQVLIAKEYKVADACQADTWKEDDITVLIGSDAYWRVTTGKIDRINERLTAIDTTFGWMAQGPIKSDLRFPSSALFVSSSDSAADLDVPSMWCLDAIGIDGAHSLTLEGNHHLFGSELGVSKRNKNHPVDNAVTSSRKVEEGETAGEHVDAHLGRARRRHWWQNGGDAALAQLVSDRLLFVRAPRRGSHLRDFTRRVHRHQARQGRSERHKSRPQGRKGVRQPQTNDRSEQALPEPKRAARRNSRAVCRLQKPAQERFEHTAQKERKGRYSSFNGDVNEMEDKAQVNDLGYVPLFELLPISGEDTSGLEGTCTEPLQQSLPKTTESISQRKRMPLEELESVEKMFDSVNQPFHILPKLTEPGSCQVLPNMNCEIGMDTNVVHFYENNKNAVAEKAMNSSYVSLPQLINDLNNIGLMITDRLLKSSRCHWLSWKSIRPRRRLESKLDELQQLISSQFLLGSGHVSVPQRASASGLANARPLQRKARHRQRLSTELPKRRQRSTANSSNISRNFSTCNTFRMSVAGSEEPQMPVRRVEALLSDHSLTVVPADEEAGFAVLSLNLFRKPMKL
ncbi:hypothetical protein HPB52_009381 [Rhipicephalus sanguineus]|uniref:CCHC-type domain-containing protein n=1 Tax=Rhipicephalus sanguineus TaxID=34632 RepID=A0A9D4PIA0_RHISA|nr:hypothetical protein HPB52_009381 [Rhipicephalus sanguineus]